VYGQSRRDVVGGGAPAPPPPPLPPPEQRPRKGELRNSRCGTRPSFLRFFPTNAREYASRAARRGDATLPRGSPLFRRRGPCSGRGRSLGGVDGIDVIARVASGRERPRIRLACGSARRRDLASGVPSLSAPGALFRSWSEPRRRRRDRCNSAGGFGPRRPANTPRVRLGAATRPCLGGPLSFGAGGLVPVVVAANAHVYALTPQKHRIVNCA